MLEIIQTLVFMSWIAFIECKMEPFIVGGENAEIRKFPHAAFLAASCYNEYSELSPWICGGSIINEKLILTAAHCLYGCSFKSKFTISVGHMNYRKGNSFSIRHFLIHERYDENTIVNDIAIVRLQINVEFGKNVKRIVLMKSPPYRSKAQVAGWGMTNEYTSSAGTLLKFIDQFVWESKSCKQVITSMPRGTICSSSGHPESYSSRLNAWVKIMLGKISSLAFMSWIAFIECNMEPYVVGGKFANITQFSHVGYMGALCFENIKISSWMCGASILNEMIALTAAHCVSGCSYRSKIIISVGNVNKHSGFKSSVRSYLIHSRYFDYALFYDIALLRFKTALTFGKNVQRIALMKDPPYNEIAKIAGWGLTNEINKTISPFLMYVKQYVWKNESCKEAIKMIPKGAICASSGDLESYASSISDTRSYWICGGSIVNQLIVLTAGHCLYGCTRRSTITVSVGHAHQYKGFGYTVNSYRIHEKYNAATVANDIALVVLKKRLKFGKNVKKIALMQNAPYNGKAETAGWGLYNEGKKSMAMYLQHIDQYLWKTTACKQVIKSLSKGTICASSGKSDSYISSGDSGSALVVRGYIQIGLVSFKMPSISRSLVVYTDTGYFYDWIVKNAKKLYCVIEQPAD